jgi:uncharacterized protein (DUF58 family)
MPVAASAAVLTVWGVVAHDSGAGWVQAIGALVAGALLVGVVAPAIVVARVRCQVVRSPHDATAGAPFALEVVSTVPVEVRPLDPPGPPVVAVDREPGRRRLRGAHATLELRCAHRGVLDRCTVAVASAAPFGILWWTRTVTLPLPHPLAVAPRVGRQRAAARAGRDPALTSLAAPGRGTEPRGVRPYEPGDRRTLVHWPATAHTGSLMVRETERTAQHAVIVDGRLPAEPGAAERQAERVMSTVAALLQTGARVELGTVEPEGEVVAPVDSLRAAGRRLALALPRVEGRS